MKKGLFNGNEKQKKAVKGCFGVRRTFDLWRLHVGDWLLVKASRWHPESGRGGMMKAFVPNLRKNELQAIPVLICVPGLLLISHLSAFHSLPDTLSILRWLQ